jgi:hypothetical protein
MAYTILLVEPDLGFYIVFSMYLAGLYIYGRINPIPLLKGFAGFYADVFFDWPDEPLARGWGPEPAANPQLSLLAVSAVFLPGVSALSESTTVGEITAAHGLATPAPGPQNLAISPLDHERPWPSALCLGSLTWRARRPLALRLRGIRGIPGLFFPFVYLSEPQPDVFSVFSGTQTNLSSQSQAPGL